MSNNTETQELRALVERLRKSSETASRILRDMAEAKSLRQADNPEQRKDLYEWPKPEQTIEGRAADGIESLLDHIERLQAALERIADPRNTHFAGDAQVAARLALEQQP